MRRPPLIFLRHGETDWNVEARLQGQRDIPLNDKGRGQARRNGEALKLRLPAIAGYDFVASPLGRARETMEIARRAMGLDPAAYRLDDRLKEIGFGDWEGYTGDDIERLHPELAAARRTDKWSFLPPKGESYAVLADRVAGWLAGLDRPTVAVAHGGVGRVMRKILLDLDSLDAVQGDFPQDRYLVFENGAETWV